MDSPGPLHFDPGCSRDCVTLGRANMDIYTEVDKTIEETSTFQKSVGGSPANIAVAMARLGKRVGMITRVGDDPIGHFVVGFLAQEGVDTSQIGFDTSGANTSLAVAETRSSGSRTVLYRQNPADMLLTSEDISAPYIEDSASLLVSGSALCTSPCREAAMEAIRIARNAGRVVVLDIDYRAKSWESLESAAVTLAQAAALSDVVIGTREEFDVLEHRVGEPDSTNPARDKDSASKRIAAGSRLVIIKRGPDGSTAFGAGGVLVHGPVYPVKAAKPYGAGDAFAGCLIAGLIDSADLAQTLKYAAAAASINVSRTRCAEDMPRPDEIEDFLKERENALSH